MEATPGVIRGQRESYRNYQHISRNLHIPRYSTNAMFLIADLQKAASVQAMLKDIFVKIKDIFNEKNASSYLGVIHGNFTIWDDVKEPAVT